jgi:hypothetical protein
MISLSGVVCSAAFTHDGTRFMALNCLSYGPITKEIDSIQWRPLLECALQQCRLEVCKLSARFLSSKSVLCYVNQHKW